MHGFALKLSQHIKTVCYLLLGWAPKIIACKNHCHVAIQNVRKSQGVNCAH